MNKDQKCVECTYYGDSENKEQGMCRRNPPQLVVLTQTGMQEVGGLDGQGIMRRGTQPVTQHKIQSMYPPVDNDDVGCGEYVVRREQLDG